MLDTHIVLLKDWLNACYASPNLCVTWHLFSNMAANSYLIQEKVLVWFSPVSWNQVSIYHVKIVFMLKFNMGVVNSLNSSNVRKIHNT